MKFPVDEVEHLRAAILEQEGSPTSSPDGEAGGTPISGGNNT